ncbi:MAG: outer membrane lipoprotein-sorting protein [Spirochaetota bacterium]|nr:outer membrane lipoprotein-sorting protein [Spirochaetota bacterium]
MKEVFIDLYHKRVYLLPKIIYSLFLILLLQNSFYLILYAETRINQELPLYEIVNGVNKILSYPKGEISGRMLHLTPQGESRLITITALISDDDYLFKFRSKPRGNELKILFNLKKRDIWVYNILDQQIYNKKNIDRFDSILLTNYYFIDLSRDDYISNYNIEMKGNATVKDYNCYKLDLVPKKKDWGYGLLTMYISKNDLVPLRIEYHDTNNILFKTLAVTKVIEKDKSIIPIRYDMLDIKNRTVTILEFTEFKRHAEFSREIFRHFNLGR